MSAKTTGHIWDLRLPHAEMLVLLAMADEADHRGGHISASVGLIAWKSGYSERQVHRIIRDLTSAGLLVLLKTELGAANTYRIDITAGKVKPEYYDRDAAKAHHTPDKMSYPPMTKRHTPSDKMSGEVRQNVRGGYDKMAIDHDSIYMNHESPPTTMDGDDGFFFELRKRNVGKQKAREIANISCDHARILALIDNRPNPDNPNSLGRLIIDILDGVADRVPVRAVAKGAPSPPAPVAGLSAEQLRDLKTQHDYKRQA